MDVQATASQHKGVHMCMLGSFVPMLRSIDVQSIYSENWLIRRNSIFKEYGGLTSLAD